MTVLFEIVFFLEFLFHGYCIYTYCSSVFKDRRSSINPLIFYLAASAIQYVQYRVLNILPVSIITMILLVVAASLLSYRPKLILCVFHSIVINSLFLVTEILTLPTINFVLSDNYIVSQSNMSELVNSTFSKLLFFFICRVISYFSEKEQYTSKSLLLLIIPFLTMLCTIIIVPIFNYGNSLEFNLIILTFDTAMLIINIVVFGVHESYVKNVKETEKLKLQEQKKQLDYDYYKILQTNYEHSKVMTHDIRHHINALCGMAENNDILSVKKYLNSLKKQENIIDNTPITGCKIVDVIIHQKSEQCKIDGISFKFIHNNTDLSFIDEVDICCILSNLLDNAIEAARKSQEKKIETVFYTNNTQWTSFIEISNSCDASPELKNGKPITIKEDTENHGIGITSAEKTVSKYGGYIIWDFNDNSHVFKTTVTINKKTAKA